MKRIGPFEFEGDEAVQGGHLDQAVIFVASFAFVLACVQHDWNMAAAVFVVTRVGGMLRRRGLREGVA